MNSTKTIEACASSLFTTGIHSNIQHCKWVSLKRWLQNSTTPGIMLFTTWHRHTCLPQNCIFRNKNHQNPEHSIIFQNTSANVSPHLCNTYSYQILQENQRAIHCAPPLSIRCSWEHCLLITLNCPPVQSFHNNIANFRVHASVTFHMTKGHFSWYAFLNVWKHVLFTGDGLQVSNQ